MFNLFNIVVEFNRSSVNKTTQMSKKLKCSDVIEIEIETIHHYLGSTTNRNL